MSLAIMEEQIAELHRRTLCQQHWTDCCDTSNENAITTATSGSAGVTEDGDNDLVKLRRHLESERALNLLDNIPEADMVEFDQQDDLDKALPKRLLIGRPAESDGSKIYAYMQLTGAYHGIKFYVVDAQGHDKKMISAADVAKQQVMHPFDKTYPKDSHDIDQNERARLTLMVKWYFIAAGIAKDCVLKETKAYPGRLRSALEYIAQRMGPAAAEPTSLVYEGRIEASPPVPRDTTLADVIPDLPVIPRQASPFPTTITEEQHRGSIEPTSQGIKRSAAAELDELVEVVSQARTTRQKLSHQIQYIDQQLVPLQKQVQLLVTQREKLVDKRIEMGNNVKKQTMDIVQGIEY